MIFLRICDKKTKIVLTSYSFLQSDVIHKINLASSLIEFLSRYSTGNVFDEGGLYEWYDELGIK
jgi:hypothetical protein